MAALFYHNTIILIIPHLSTPPTYIPLNPTAGQWRMRLHDAFIVRYDATAAEPCSRSLSLPEHRDTSSMSFTLALNEGGGVDYEGGGTWFEALEQALPLPGKASLESVDAHTTTPVGRVVNVPLGHATAFAGPLRHAGEYRSV